MATNVHQGDSLLPRGASPGVLGWQGYAADLVCFLLHNHIVNYEKLRMAGYVYCICLWYFCCNSVAVMTRAFPEYSKERQELVLLQNIACYLLLSCGVVYIISGILCIGSLKRARLKEEVSRDQAVKDLQELEHRREELEAFLIEDRT
ncbi:hypothetical protein ACH5RR_002078 [Cinchona calisaya]|uniref:Uncharacterized protein n=1 Tax=Cinchona calisaya TaxID=153742 RepID=A0ABD3B580_9GENT